MTSYYKIRSPLLPTGGIIMTSGSLWMDGAQFSACTTQISASGALTTGSLNNISGCAVFGASGVKIGTNGIKLSKFVFGTVTVTSPSFGAVESASVSVKTYTTLTGVAAEDKIFVTAGSLKPGLIIVAASATAASTAEVMWSTTGCLAVAEDVAVSLHYLALS